MLVSCITGSILGTHRKTDCAATSPSFAWRRKSSGDRGTYFDPQAPEDLADNMVKVRETTPPCPDLSGEEKFRSVLKKRMRLFGETFVDILKKVVLRRIVKASCLCLTRKDVQGKQRIETGWETCPINRDKASIRLDIS
jgi:hypothetical protein